MLFSWTDGPLAGAADDAWWAGQVHDAAVERGQDETAAAAEGPAL